MHDDAISDDERDPNAARQAAYRARRIQAGYAQTQCWVPHHRLGKFRQRVRELIADLDQTRHVQVQFAHRPRARIRARLQRDGFKWDGRAWRRRDYPTTAVEELQRWTAKNGGTVSFTRE